MNQNKNSIFDHPLSFSRLLHHARPPEAPSQIDPPNTDGTIFASNVLWGTNQDLTPSTACQGKTPETPARQRKTARMKIRFTEEELADVKRKAAEAGLDCSKYIRAKLNAATVRPAPVVNTAELLADVRRAGRHINDVIAKANALGFLDVPELRKALEESCAVSRKIIDAYSVKEGTDNE